MNNKILKELNDMKYLFGYKRGVVISEQNGYESDFLTEDVTPKQQEALNAGYGPVTDEYAKSLPVGPDGKILPKGSSSQTSSGSFASFACMSQLPTEKKATSTQVGVELKVGTKLGNVDLTRWMFEADGTLYSYGQEYGTWKCGQNANTIILHYENTDHTVTLPLTKQQSDQLGKDIKDLGKKAIQIGQDATKKVKSGKIKYVVPAELKNNVGNKTGVQAFQDWLDTKDSNWLKDYGTINANPNKGYGKFGPSTNAAWLKYKNEYLSKETDDKDIQNDSNIANSGGLGVPDDEQKGETYAPSYGGSIE